MEAGGGLPRSVSVSVLDAEIEELQRHVKRKRRISESTDDESDIASSSPKNETSSSSEKEHKARDRVSGSKGRVWGAELPRETCRSPVKRLAIAPIPPERFYASDKTDDAWLQHLETLRKPVGDTYEEFPRQELAFRFADGRPGEGLHVFARERRKEDECGLRTYIVTTYQEFWKRYKHAEPALRNYYEMIREGVCCNLYFDIEFLKAENPHIVAGGHEEALMKAFTKLVGREVQLFFALPFRVRRRHFVDLDSSDARKFSRHLVLRMPDNYVFANNHHCGHFVKMLHHKLSLLRQLHARERQQAAAAAAARPKGEGEANGNEQEEEEEEGNEEHEPLRSQDKMAGMSSEMLDRFFVMNDKGKEVFIVDMGVYTRNRNFRLIYSTKVGKQLFLRPSAINRYVPPPQQTRRSDDEGKEEEEGGMSYAWFLSSLVTRVGENKETDMKKVYLLSCEPVPSEDGRETLFYSHYLTPLTLPPSLVTGLLASPVGAAPSRHSPSGVVPAPALTFSPPPLTGASVGRYSLLPAPAVFLPRVTPECSPNPAGVATTPTALYSPLFTSPYQPALPYYALPSSTSSSSSSSSSYPSNYLSSAYSSSSSSSSSGSSFGSGFPAIDEFIAGHVGGERPGRRGGFRSVRRWNALIVYSITHNRYCENIGREHKSNHIMIVVDLRSATFYQKCYDPDCQAIDYRSPEYPLPPDVCPTTVFASAVPLTATTHEQPANQPNVITNNNNGGHQRHNHYEDQDDDRFLSDEALYQSIMDNPSLWP